MYEQYEKKMKRFRLLLRVLRGLAVAAAAFLLLAGFAIFGAGIPLGAVKCDSVVYGTKPKASVKSFAKEVTFEYRDRDGLWSTAIPKYAGIYEVRAVTKSILGICVKSGRTEFVIERAPLTVELHDIEDYAPLYTILPSEKDYDVSGLAYEDSIDRIRFSYDKDDGVRREYSVASVVMVDRNGNDVRNNYKLISESARIEDIRKSIRVRPVGRSVVYGGDPTEKVTCDSVQLLNGTLEEGEELVIRFEEGDNTGSLTEIGSVLIRGEIYVLDQYGQDVTYRYRIEREDAYLTFSPTVVTILTGSAEKVYDGIPLTEHSYTLVNGYIYPDDSLELYYTGIQYEPGRSRNTVGGYSVFNAKYGDVTKFYDVKVKQGWLRVTYPDDWQVQGADEDSFGLSTGFDLTSGHMDGDLMYVDPYTIFRVYSSRSGTQYFKEQSYELYDGHTWTNSAAVKNYKPREDYLTGRALQSAGNESKVMKISNLRLNHKVYPYFMGGQEENTSADSYECTVYAQRKNQKTFPEGEEAWEKEYRDFVYNHYLQIEPELQDLLLDLGAKAGITGYESNVVDKIARYIQNAAVYDLNYPAFPADQDMVTYFLTVSKTGICQHYAAAAVMMYRAYGIPARFTLGYVGTVKSNQWSEITTETGHAWAEVYIAGTGWIPVEVTGGSGGSGDGAGPGGVIDADGDGNEGGGMGGNPDLIVGFSTYVKEYDGFPVENWSPEPYLISGSLNPGERIVADINFSTYGTEPDYYYFEGDVDIRILDAKGNDVTLTYSSIGYTNPTIQIIRRRLEVRTQNREGTEADGQIADAGWYISEGSLIPGHRLQVTTMRSQDTVGRTNNYASVDIIDEDGNSVIYYYDVRMKSGTLEMK